LGVSEITIPAENGKLDAVADEVVAIVSQFGGSATKGVPDAGRLSILIDLPATRESEFRGAIQLIAGGTTESATPATVTTPGTIEKKSFVIQIVEAPAKSD
jgi:hypothetical protein